MDKLDIANTKILLVEDNPKYLAQLEKWFERFGYQHLDTARNPEEATEKLDQSLFEIIVADMRLGTDDGGGFVVFEEIKKRNLSAAVIILTANETVADCRRAHRMDAWDYISKNMKGNVFEELHDSIQAALAYFNRWGNRKDEKWIEENADFLEENYTNQYVAVINHGVIESADSEEVLKKQLDELKLPLFLPVIKNIEAKAPPSIAELIQKGESATVEFKRTFQYDADKEPDHKNDKLRFQVLKTIVAFLNTDGGGTLLIGVTDNGEPFGLEDDFRVAGKKKNQDEFEQALLNAIKSYITAPFIKFIDIRFEEIATPVCAVFVKKSTKPAFLKKGNKRELYIRTGCTSQLLNDAAEICDYISMRDI